ncbi:MAG: hypothetical protein PVF32_05680 [Desulfobacterales bacterium]|jgi:hypothetical protein
MIIAFVQIPLDGPKRPRKAVIAQSLESTKIFHNVKGMRRKYYLNSDDGGGGIYEFAIRADAEAWFQRQMGRLDGRPLWGSADVDHI